MRATRAPRLFTIGGMPTGRPLTAHPRALFHRGGGKLSARDAEQAADREIARLAERQHGVVARRQLLGLGISSRAVEGRVQRGRLHGVHQGVYTVGHRLLSREGRWTAAVLAGGTGTVLSHRSAGRLWGVLPRAPGMPEVTRPHDLRRPGIVVHRSLLPADERAEVDGIRVTSVSRTILDLAVALPREQLEKALNEAEVLGLTDRISVPALLERYPRRRGTGTLRAVLGGEKRLRGVTQNDFEELFASLVDAHRLPRPRFNADLAVRGRFVRPDALWDEARLIVELDGRATHGTARAFENDRERDRLLLTEGWQVVRVTWRQLRDEPARVAADLQGLLRQHRQPPYP